MDNIQQTHATGGSPFGTLTNNRAKIYMGYLEPVHYGFRQAIYIYIVFGQEIPKARISSSRIKSKRVN